MSNLDNMVTVDNREEKAVARREDIKAVLDRTGQLFQVIDMCAGNEEQVRLCQNEIVELNIKLVSHVLKKYKPFGDDEFQTGCLGLIRASRGFKADKGVPFANFACFCIERELHKVHKGRSNTFEYQMGNQLESLDIMLNLDNGDQAAKHDKIADPIADAMFNEIMSDFALDNIFDSVIIPAIDEVSKSTGGQATNMDYDLWKSLEMRYLLELAEIESQQGRVTFTSIANTLGVSTQNIRIKHRRVVENIKAKCIEAGIEI